MSRGSIHCALLLAIAIVLFSCNRKSKSLLHPIWSYIKEYPDSALALLNQHSLKDFKSDKSRAEFALLKSIAMDKNYIDSPDDSLIKVAFEYYNKRGTPKEKMLSWYYLARIQDNAGDYNKAIVSLFRAEQFLAVDEDPYYEGLIHMERESLYNRTYNNEEALSEALLGVKVFTESGEYRQALIAKRRLGLDYLALRDFHNADSVFLSIAEDCHADSSFIADALFNYARSLVLESRYEEAQELFTKGSNIYHGRLNAHQANAYAYALSRGGRLDEGISILKQTSNIPEIRSSAFNYLHRIEKDLGHFDEALTYFEQAIALQDSITLAMMSQSIIKTQRDYQQSEKELFRLNAEKNRDALVWVISLMILGSLLTMVIVINSRNSHRQRIANLESSIEKAEELNRILDSNNESLNHELEDTRRQFISAYKKRFYKIAHLAETYYRTSGHKEGRDLVYTEVMDLASFIATDAHTFRQLERNVNANLSDAMSLYRLEIPAKESDYRFVCYLMAGFPASTISLILGESESAIYGRKHRLIGKIEKSSAAHKKLFVSVLKN